MDRGRGGRVSAISASRSRSPGVAGGSLPFSFRAAARAQLSPTITAISRHGSERSDQQARPSGPLSVGTDVEGAKGPWISLVFPGFRWEPK